MKFLAALLFLLLPLSLPAQTISVKVTCGSDVQCQEQNHTSRFATWNEQLPVKHRTADRKFWAMMAVSQAATVGDILNSRYALQLPGTKEANPFLSSPVAMWGVAEGIYGIEGLYTWHSKRQDDALRDAGLSGHKYAKWWVMPLLNVGAHGVGIGITLGSTGR